MLEKEKNGIKPLVSIIMPIYNVEDYLIPALDSIRNQSYANIELIAVNDGSTDSSLELLNGYKNKYMDFGLTVISQVNKGLSEARNAGLPHVKGKYLYFFDSDDLLALDCIEKCTEFALANDLDIVHFGAEVIEKAEGYDENGYFNTELRHGKVYSGTEFFIHSSRDIRIPVWLYFFKSEIIIGKLGFYPGLIHEDELFTPCAIGNAAKIGVLNEKFFKRRLRKNSIMTTQNEKLNNMKIESVDIIIDELKRQRNKSSHEKKFFIESRIINLSIKKNKLKQKKTKIPFSILGLLFTRQIKKRIYR